ncbi:hypothetical protein EDB92DRAFT_1818206 [Lactarius akahatsu]|uniref:Fungal STAND N-terminal Goodbye domain-containing protein n=1 Tax=Lactarius akahatsu TaxID=416441 RepID=A0AAD4LAK2_9AGAM|nr:hypothetical protein EDB92DRAFT_1818206 [Lactarius akahatsu]
MSTASSNFRTIFVAALNEYEKKTKTNLLTHPLATQLQSCNFSSDILAVLHNKVNEFNQARSHNERLSSWLNPTIKVLYALSATLGEGLGLASLNWSNLSIIFSPAKVISVGIGVLLLAAKDVDASREVLADLFERLENFFKRLEFYMEVPPTEAMTDIIVKIMTEVLNIFAIVTKKMKQGRASALLPGNTRTYANLFSEKFFKKLVGRKDIEDALARLDKLTQEEARMAATHILSLTHAVDNKVTSVGNKLKDVDDRMDVVIRDGKDAEVVLQQTSNNVDDMRWNQLRESLKKWAAPPDPSKNHNIACDIHHGGTAEWFFQSSFFAEWKSSGFLLWIYGKQLTLPSSSTIIQDTIKLREAGLALMAYFYFDSRDLDKQHRRNLPPSLLIQLSAQSRPCCDILSHLYSVHDNGAQMPSDSVMIRCHKDMLTIPNQQPVYIVLDALDECPNWPGIPSPREQVLALVKELVDLHLPHLHICVTSRPELDIRATLTPCGLWHATGCPYTTKADNRKISSTILGDDDEERTTRKWLSKRFQKRPTGCKGVVLAPWCLLMSSHMFRWVYCQLDALRQCLPWSVRRTLNELPESLDETYERTSRKETGRMRIVYFNA